MRGKISVGQVQASDVEAGPDQALEHVLAFGSGTDGGDDFGFVCWKGHSVVFQPLDESRIGLNTEPSTNGWPVSSDFTLATVTRAISDSASRVRNAWCAVTMTLGKVSNRANTSSCST